MFTACSSSPDVDGCGQCPLDMVVFYQKMVDKVVFTSVFLGHGGVFTSNVFLGGAPAVQHRPSANFPSLLPQFQGNQPFPGAMSSMINDCWRHECRCFQNIFLQSLHSQQIPVTGVPADSPWIRLPNPKEKVRKKYRYLGFDSIKQKISNKPYAILHLKL